MGLRSESRTCICGGSIVRLQNYKRHGFWSQNELFSKSSTAIENMQIIEIVSFVSLIAYASCAVTQLNLYTRVRGGSPLTEKFDNKPIFFQTGPSGHYYLEVATDDSGLSKREVFSVYTYDDEEQAIYKQITDNLRANLTVEDEIMQMTFLKPLVARLVELKSGLLEKLLSFKEIAGLFITQNVPLPGGQESYIVTTSGYKKIGDQKIPIDIVAREVK
ncbi:hypothetical protein KGF57_002480 [Candida theae]|uniref:Uncharacterized protein n=1 Tax=Candida theae TaxID=1198502 RepID=A0AAD5BF38_9ASCO|nr:uncharacterized protein KGF57_002480 [Candida theae]KAI5958635.1 hypothetical protein KGF57_002480 [Candida theae]